MRQRYLLIMLCACPMLAQADIYKAIDEDGHVTYSSSPIKGGKKLNLEPLPTMAPPAKASAATDFPRVNNETQRGRDETRRKILEDELVSEEKLLEEANKNLNEAEGNPEVFRTADGKILRNVARYEEKIKPLQEQVDLHSKNIEALKTELSRLPR